MFVVLSLCWTQRDCCKSKYLMLDADIDRCLRLWIERSDLFTSLLVYQFSTRVSFSCEPLIRFARKSWVRLPDREMFWFNFLFEFY